MPMFKVCVQQYVEETAVVEIEAGTAEKARQVAERMLRDGLIEDWQDGDDVLQDGNLGYGGVYAVKDEGDVVVWER
ncbi:hypothetical protein IVB12_15535 [Bradyrhizobium sp. 179]|uniref:hypothetical protein n=1 Tax=Bradyrhizobium sp. 179 TaxID=2782648 RepID=UPI001FF78BFC|nr:hypothetical protein [Bradyrhizobium sp. 179]MCK1543327.1 hypothetical protein [Bradyrhizobium sp. 179]